MLPRAVLFLALLFPLAAPAQQQSADIVHAFRLYFEQQVANDYSGPLDFLGDAAAAKVSPDRIIAGSASREVVVDRPNGYLQIADSSSTDQTLTLALYRRSEGPPLLAVGSSNCADGCKFLVQFFDLAGGKLQSVPAASLVPAIAPSEFVEPGKPMPKAIDGLSPTVDFQPARVGTSLVLKPWYGYETEEQMDEATRAMIRDVELKWDRAQGRFVR
ncbi:MAG: hypothetical protein JOY81_08215 [Alphaproteobacteria bacterium]|nr:hypothetical protein [Alphaproteobacteria bacterium]